ncbi:MAG: ACT domain-containing protein [Armatimonadota bacterium]
MMRTPSDAIRNSPVRLMPGRYAVLRCADVPDGTGWFMIARDPDEVTVIVEESAILESRALETDGGYRILEIKVATGFESVGFLATVTRALAEAGVSILVVSTYSKDYVLVKEESVAAGLKALSGIGFGFAGV